MTPKKNSIDGSLGAGGPSSTGDYVPGSPAPETAARLREQLADDWWLDDLIDRADQSAWH